MKNILIWFKKYMVFIIVIGVVAVTSFLLWKFIFSKSPMKSETSSNATTNNQESSNVLPDGTYECEFMYNGKSLEDDEVIIDFIQKLATYESSIDMDKINIRDFRDNLFEEFGTTYIVKKNETVQLNINNDGHQHEFVLYDISNNQFTLNKDLFDTDSENALDTLETFFNKMVHVKQSKDDFVFTNFGFLFIYPTIYNNFNNNISLDESVNMDYDKYTDLGDLVCRNVHANNFEEPNQEPDSNSKYLGKYIGESEYFPEMSYIELYDSNKAILSMNNCEGFSTYHATYKIKYDEDLGSNLLYVTSLSISDGRTLDIPETLMFQMKDNELIVLSGYDGNLFDCSRTTKLIKSN